MNPEESDAQSGMDNLQQFIAASAEENEVVGGNPPHTNVLNESTVSYKGQFLSILGLGVGHPTHSETEGVSH